jgi:chromate transporter
MSQMATAGSAASHRLAPVLALITRASTLHVGGIATMTWLRRRFVDTNSLTAAEFDRAFVVARLTPGTNLLAFFAAVGYTVSRWRGAIASLLISSVLPSVITVALSVLYVDHAASPLVARFMEGARAAAVAILGWNAVQLFVLTAGRRWLRALGLAAATLAAVTSGRAPLIVILLVAAAAGTLLFRSDA